MATSTLLVLLRELAERLDDDGLFVTGTATSGTSTTLVDTTEPGLYYSDGDANLFDRWFVYNELSGAIGRVNRGGLAGSTGILTLTGGEFGDEGTGTAAVSTTTAGGTGTLTDTRVSWVTDQWVGATVTCNSQTMTVTSNTATVLTGTGDWSSDPGDGNAWSMTGVCPYILTSTNPVVSKKTINRILDNLTHKVFFPLSIDIVTNDANDMETSTLDGDYSKSASAAIAAETTKVHDGGQSMKVTASAATQYAYTANIPVNETQNLYAAVMNAVDSGDSAEFRIVNVDDSNAAIENATNDEVAWMELIFNFTPPSGCERIQAWMISTANTDVSYWDDYQIWASGRYIYELPSWIVYTGQLDQGDVREFPQGTGGPASDNDYRANEQMSRPIDWGWENTDTAGKFRIWVDCGSARPFICALRPYAQLSSDTATTTADLNQLMGWAVRYLEAETAKEKDGLLGLIRAMTYTSPKAKSPIRYRVRIG